MTTLKVLKTSDFVSIVFGEWFDKTYGNTYYDATVIIKRYDKSFNCILSEEHQIPQQYGYNAGDIQSIDEALKASGYRVRNNKQDKFKPYEKINTTIMQVLKRNLNK